LQKFHVSQIESGVEEGHKTVGEIELKNCTTLNKKLRNNTNINIITINYH